MNSVPATINQKLQIDIEYPYEFEYNGSTIYGPHVGVFDELEYGFTISLWDGLDVLTCQMVMLKNGVVDFLLVHARENQYLEVERVQKTLKANKFEESKFFMDEVAARAVDMCGQELNPVSRGKLQRLIANYLVNNW